MNNYSNVTEYIQCTISSFLHLCSLCNMYYSNAVLQYVICYNAVDVLLLIYCRLSLLVSSACILCLYPGLKKYFRNVICTKLQLLLPPSPCVPRLCSALLLHTALLMYKYTFMQNIYAELTTSIYRENRF